MTHSEQDGLFGKCSPDGNAVHFGGHSLPWALFPHGSAATPRGERPPRHAERNPPIKSRTFSNHCVAPSAFRRSLHRNTGRTPCGACTCLTALNCLAQDTGRPLTREQVTFAFNPCLGYPYEGPFACGFLSSVPLRFKLPTPKAAAQEKQGDPVMLVPDDAPPPTRGMCSLACVLV